MLPSSTIAGAFYVPSVVPISDEVRLVAVVVVAAS